MPYSRYQGNNDGGGGGKVIIHLKLKSYMFALGCNLDLSKANVISSRDSRQRLHIDILFKAPLDEVLSIFDI